MQFELPWELSEERPKHVKQVAVCAQCNINGVSFVVAAGEELVTVRLPQVIIEKWLVWEGSSWVIAMLTPLLRGPLPNPNRAAVGLLFDETVH